MKTVLVTGGAGFIGSCFIKMAGKARPQWRIVNLDLLTYAGNMRNLDDLQTSSRYIFVKGDICDQSLVSKIFTEYQPDYIINFAAESHVDRSISDPSIFIKTNVLGTQVLLDETRKLFDSKRKCRFLQVSTDEVYGALGSKGSFTEETPLAPNSPYSASKASADMLVRAYHKTYGLNTLTTRCSNNYGPYQFPEKLIPLMVSNCMQGKPLPVYGDGKQVRDWLHVEDHCRALLAVLERGRTGEVYNIGGCTEVENLQLVKKIIECVQSNVRSGIGIEPKSGVGEHQIKHVEDRLGHDRRYAIDNTKVRTELGWEPEIDFDCGMVDTIQWYMEHLDWVEAVLNRNEKKFGA